MEAGSFINESEIKVSAFGGYPDRIAFLNPDACARFQMAHHLWEAWIAAGRRGRRGRRFRRAALILSDLQSVESTGTAFHEDVGIGSAILGEVQWFSPLERFSRVFEIGVAVARTWGGCRFFGRFFLSLLQRYSLSNGSESGGFCPLILGSSFW